MRLDFSSGFLMGFFSKIALKISICFLNLTYSETGERELSPDMHFRHVGQKSAELAASQGNRKKIRKSRDFRGISKISGTNVSRSDTYPEKKYRDFRTVIFGIKKKFCGKSSFFVFCEKIGRKIHIFGNIGYCSKEKNLSVGVNAETQLGPVLEFLESLTHRF